MSVKEDRAYTQCSVDFHMQKRFMIALPKPSEDRLEEIKNRFGFAKLAFDSDRDLVGRDAKISDSTGELVIRELGVLSSSDRAAVICLGDTTERATAILQEIVSTTFDISVDTFRTGVEYITYDTTTKVQFSEPLTSLFSDEFQKILDTWRDIDSKAVVAPFESAKWPPNTSAMVHTTPEYWEKYFGKDAPKKALVIPQDLDFFIYLPSRFYKMTKYRFRVSVESVEDFLEHRYFAKSELPHLAHIDLLNKLDEIIRGEPKPR